ncbi:hypothetical protein KX924_04340 [Streptomyces sp. II-2-2-2]
MQIPRTLAALAVLLIAIAAWLLLVAPAPGVRYYEAQEMAPATLGADGALPTAPPKILAWQPANQRELVQWRGPYWLRWRLPAPANQHAADRALRVSVRAASQPFWNGQPLAANGIVGRSAEEEQPG